MTDDGQSYKYVWDAFGRLVTAKNQGGTVIAEYKYNGLGYRTGWHYDVTRSGGGNPDGTVDSYDPWYFFCYDDRWRPIAIYRGTDTYIKERTVCHAAGANGLGGSSYIDSYVMRDSGTEAWKTAPSNGTRSVRNYYCQNWRADVVVVTDNAGTPIEWVRYSAYGVPFSYALADLNHDGVINGDDETAFWDAVSNNYALSDINFDGDHGTDADITTFYNSYNAASTGGRGVLSRSKTLNRIGYAGYQWDSVINSNHVRHRVDYVDLGRWLSRDLVRDSQKYTYCDSQPVGQIDFSGLTPICLGGCTKSVYHSEIDVTRMYSSGSGCASVSEEEFQRKVKELESQACGPDSINGHTDCPETRDCTCPMTIISPCTYVFHPLTGVTHYGKLNFTNCVINISWQCSDPCTTMWKGTCINVAGLAGTISEQ